MAKILVTDDLKENHVLIKMGLRNKPFELMHVYSGEEALEKLNEFKPDLILMDIQMPGIDGFETAKIIKQNPTYAKVPILFMSALKDISNILKCYESGGVDYISKPFKIPELLARINTHITMSQLQNQLSDERDKIQTILNNILPQHYINQLKSGIQPQPELKTNVVVAFADFQNFTSLSQQLGPEKSISHLNHLFYAFDDITSRFGMERVKTLGDGYFAISINEHNDADHALKSVAALIKCQEFVEHYNRKHPEINWKLRVGAHIGNVVTGIVGYQKIAFDVWGPSVNLASRLQSVSGTNTVAISEELYKCLGQNVIVSSHDTYDIHRLGPLEVYHIKGLSDSSDPSIKAYFNNFDISKLLDSYDLSQGLIHRLFNTNNPDNPIDNN